MRAAAITSCGGWSISSIRIRDTAAGAARPDIVVYPESTEEVAAVLAYADRERIPVIPFGAGTSLEGHVIPLSGGISLDLSRMNRIVAVRPEDLTATVEAGVTRLQFEA